uniref:Uncharacterized protein n=1 Tax=Anopheles christyi TaxID=43041 RepID=A0A182KD55_9DIPT
MVRRAVSTSPESTNHHHHLNSHHHLSQAQTPTSSTSSLSSASDGQPVSQQPSPSSQQHSPVSVSSAPGGGGGVGPAANAANPAGGHGYDVLQFVRQLPAPLPGQQHVHLTPAPHGENGGGPHGGPPAAGSIFIAAGPYANEYYTDHSYYYPHPDYGSPPPTQHICPVHHEYGSV